MSALATPEDVLAGRAQWCVTEGAWQDVLPRLPDASIGVTLTDPPYAPRSMKNFRSAAMVQRRDGEVREFGYGALLPVERRAVSREIARLTKRWASVWCDAESDHAWRVLLQRAGMRYVRTAGWLREHGAPQFSGDRPGQDLELCVVAHAADGRMRWNGGGLGVSAKGPIVNANAGEREHSSPKPLWLMLDQVEKFTEPGEVVLDPFAGSATTGVACLQLGRRCILVEKSAEYAALARARMEAEVRGLPLRALRATPAGQLPLLAGV